METPETLQSKLVTFIFLINEKIMKQMAAILKGQLTTSQFFAVAAVQGNGRMAMSELADRMGISRQQATRIVNQLVESGYMRRISSNEDRRIIEIDLTNTARRFMAGFITELTDGLRNRFSTLGNQEQEELKTAVDSFNRILPSL